MKKFVLGSKAVSANHRLIAFESVESTNIVAMQKALDGDKGNLWVVASSQTKGKGRRGRVWQTATGNLAASIFVEIPEGTRNPEILSFVAAIAVANSVKQLLGDAALDIALKWPNDVMLNKAKLAGILLESQILPNGKRVIVIGMGLNVASAPRGLSYNTIALGQFDPEITASIAFQTLSDNWVSVFNQWDYGQGRSLILQQWQDMAYGIGKPVTIERVNDSISGVFHTIDGEGRLILEKTNGQKEIISAGDVQF